MYLSQRRQRAFQALILAALGLFLLQKIWSGTLYWYINQRFAILTLLAGIGFLVLARIVSPALWARPRRGEAARPQGQPEPQAQPHPHHSHDHEPGHDHGHDHGSLSGWALLAVALPVLLGVLIPARPLGSSALANKGLNAAAPLTAGVSNGAQPARLDLAPEERTVLDWVRAFNYEADPAVFAGQPADVIGFVFHDSRLGPEQFFAGRFAVSCCVADAAGIAVIVEWPEAARLTDNSWVRVQGPVAVGQLNGRPVPLIVAEAVEAVPAPDQPYLYP
jgi:uncharacterized repeat protein (TIGR03943 family)